MRARAFIEGKKEKWKIRKEYRTRRIRRTLVDRAPTGCAAVLFAQACRFFNGGKEISSRPPAT